MSIISRLPQDNHDVGHGDSDLWTCPECGERFTGKNMWHSCGKFSLDVLFAPCKPNVRESYEALERMALEVAPFHIIPQKSRVVFQLRMRCVGATPMKSYLRAHFVLPRLVQSPRIQAIQQFKPNQFLTFVPISNALEVDETIRELIQLATVCGEQKA